MGREEHGRTPSLPSQKSGTGTPDADLLGLGERTDGVLAQTALNVRVGMAQLAAIWTFQGHLALTGPLLLAARAPVIQILDLGRVPGDRKGRMSASLPGAAAAASLPHRALSLSSSTPPSRTCSLRLTWRKSHRSPNSSSWRHSWCSHCGKSLS